MIVHKKGQQPSGRHRHQDSTALVERASVLLAAIYDNRATSNLDLTNGAPNGGQTTHHGGLSESPEVVLNGLKMGKIIENLGENQRPCLSTKGWWADVLGKMALGMGKQPVQMKQQCTQLDRVFMF